MKPTCTVLTTFVVLLAPAALVAQQPTTVQLPTFSFFGVGTSVSVPDRGSVYLGGVNRAATGMNEFGAPLMPFRNRSFGMERSASNMSVSVFIHDFDAMEEALLGGQAAPGTALAPRWPRSGPERLTARSATPAPPAPDVAQILEDRAREQVARRQEAEDFFQRGRSAEESGKPNVARIYYQMAARRAAGELKQQVAARLAAMDKAKEPPKLAQGTP